MNLPSSDTRLTAYAFGELEADAKRALEAELAQSADMQRELAEIKISISALRDELLKSPAPALDRERRARVEHAIEAAKTPPRQLKRKTPRWLIGTWSGLALAAGAALFVTATRERKTASYQWTETAAQPPPATATAPLASAAPLAVEDSPQALREERTGAPMAAPRRYSAPMAAPRRGGGAVVERRNPVFALKGMPIAPDAAEEPPAFQSERYDEINDGSFVRVRTDPRSTFSIDVDTASYALVRRYLLENRQMPPKGAVRIEELVNYFRYSYPEPSGAEPFRVQTDVASAPWAREHRLLRIGIKGREVAPQTIEGKNLVFLIDVSGSMDQENKLPLLKRAFKLLVPQLGGRDRVSIVVYAGASGLVLPPTPGSDRGRILSAIEELTAGGSTNGGEGIHLAYRKAAEAFIRGGVNRVILATDGDFNVGVTSTSELVRLVQEKAKSGVFLSVLGFGEGNYNDAMLEKLADKGNGNYAYVDTLDEAKKVLVEQASATLVTIAKDVKIQIEFNPRKVEAFRLIGYENRVLAHRDFTDDKKDAGEIGSGHTVTALYEIILASRNAPAAVDELATVKLRYKLPDSNRSKALEAAVRDRRGDILQSSSDFRVAAAVAEFGMLLRDSPHKAQSSYSQVLSLASSAESDEYRREFLRLVGAAQRLAGNRER